MYFIIYHILDDNPSSSVMLNLPLKPYQVLETYEKHINILKDCFQGEI